MKNITEEITDLENEIKAEPFRVEFDCAEYYGYPAYYSASEYIYDSPIGNIRLENNTDEEVDGVLTVSADPSFFERVTVTADEIKGKSVCVFKCPKLKQDPSALAFLPKDTAVKYTVAFNKKDGTLLAEKTVMAKLAAITSWGGVHCCPEIAASFISPDCDDVKELAERARKLYGGEYGTDGYSSKSCEDVRRLFSAVYVAVREMRITYASGAFYPDEKGVYVSPPELTLHKKSGNSMELALVIVSVLKSLGMNTVLVFTSAATLPGVFTEGISFSVPVIDGADEVRNAVRDGRLILIDPATVIKGINVSFDSSEEGAWEILKRNDKYYLTLDIKACNDRGIRSLPPRMVTDEGLMFADESTGVPENFFAVGGERDEFEKGKDKRPVSGKRKVLDRSLHLAGRAMSAERGSYYATDRCCSLTVNGDKLFDIISNGKAELYCVPENKYSDNGKMYLLTRESIGYTAKAVNAHGISRYTRSSRDELLLSFCPITYKDEAKGHYYTAPLCFVPVKAKADEATGKLILEKASPNNLILNTVLTERLDKLFGADLYDCEKLCNGGLAEAVKYIKDRTFGFSRSEIFVNEKEAFLEFADITPLTSLRSSFKDKISAVSPSDKVTAEMYKTPFFVPKEVEASPAEILLGGSAYEALKSIREKKDTFVRSDSLHSKALFAFKAAKESADRGERVLYVSDSLRSAELFKSYFDAFGVKKIYKDHTCVSSNGKKLSEHDKVFLKEEIPAQKCDEAEDVTAMKKRHDSYLEAIVKKHPIGLSLLSACKGYYQQYDSPHMSLFDKSRLGKMTREDVSELFLKVSEYLSVADELLEALKKDGENVNIFDTPLNKVYMTSSSDEESGRLCENASVLCKDLLERLSALDGAYGLLTEFIFGKASKPEFEKIKELCRFASLLLSSEKASKYVLPEGDISMYADARIALSLLGEARELKKGREIFGEELSALPKLPPDPVTFRDSYAQSMKKGFFAKKGAKTTLLKQFENLLSDPSLVDAGKAEMYTNRLARAYELESKADIGVARAIFGDNEDSAVMEELAEILFRLSEGAERIVSLYGEAFGKTPSLFMSKNVRECLLRLEDKDERDRIKGYIKEISSSADIISSLIRQLSDMLFMKDVPEAGDGYKETEDFFKALDDSLSLIPLWCKWRYVNVEAREYGFDSLTLLFAGNIITADEARDAFVKGFYKTVCDHIIEGSDVLREFSSEKYTENTEKLIAECIRLERYSARICYDDSIGNVEVSSVTDIPSEYFGGRKFDLVIFDDGETAPASLLSPVMPLGETCLILSLEREGETDKRAVIDTSRIFTYERETMTASSCASRVFDTYYRADALFPYYNEKSLSAIVENESVSVSLIRADGMCLSSPDSVYPAVTERRADDMIRSSYINKTEAALSVCEAEKLLASDEYDSCIIYALTDAQCALIKEEIEKKDLARGGKLIAVSSPESRLILPADGVIFSAVLSLPHSSVFPGILPSGGGVTASAYGERIFGEMLASARKSFTVITSLDEKNLTASSELFDPYGSLKRALRRYFFSENPLTVKLHEKAPLSPAAELYMKRGGSKDSVFDEEILLTGKVTAEKRVYTVDILKG